MTQVTVSLPDKASLALKVAAEELGNELLLAAAVKLYEVGRLSSGAAAELAGIPKPLFLAKLGDYEWIVGYPGGGDLVFLNSTIRTTSAGLGSMRGDRPVMMRHSGPSFASARIRRLRPCQPGANHSSYFSPPAPKASDVLSSDYRGPAAKRRESPSLAHSKAAQEIRRIDNRDAAKRF